MTNKQKPSAVYKTTKDKQSSGLLSLLWIVVLMLVVSALAVVLYFSPMAESYRNSTKIMVVEEEPVRPITQTEAAPSPNFEFYDVLPKQDFRSVPEGVSVQEIVDTNVQTLDVDTVVQSDKGGAEIPEQSEANQSDDAHDTHSVAQITTTYILQIKSYPNAKDADEKRAEVMLAGVDATVVRREDKATGVSFYQVVSVPMTTSSQASQALLRLRNNGIDALIVEQRHK